MSSIDNHLFDLNEKGRDKSKRRKKKSTKEKAEFQFDVTAAPIKLNVFFKDVMENSPDVPALNESSNNNGIKAQMLPVIPDYTTDCHEYSGEILEFANDLLIELDESSNLENSELFQDSISNEVTEPIIELKSVIKDINKDILSEKMEYKELTAKRLGLKALQMFTFSDHYHQHFHFDVRELRSYNVDMFVDKTESSLRFLKIWGLKYFKHYTRYWKCDHFTHPFVYNIRSNNKARKAIGYSFFLSKLSMNDLLRPGEPIDDPKIESTIYNGLTLNEILTYFGFKFFDHNQKLIFSLQHLNIITGYYPPRKKFLVKNLFDKKSDRIRIDKIGTWDPNLMNLEFENE